MAAKFVKCPKSYYTEQFEKYGYIRDKYDTTYNTPTPYDPSLLTMLTGDEIYRSPPPPSHQPNFVGGAVTDPPVSMFEVDGKKAKVRSAAAHVSVISMDGRRGGAVTDPPVSMFEVDGKKAKVRSAAAHVSVINMDGRKGKGGFLSCTRCCWKYRSNTHATTLL